MTDKLKAGPSKRMTLTWEERNIIWSALYSKRASILSGCPDELARNQAELISEVMKRMEVV